MRSRNGVSNSACTSSVLRREWLEITAPPQAVKINDWIRSCAANAEVLYLSPRVLSLACRSAPQTYPEGVRYVVHDPTIFLVTPFGGRNRQTLPRRWAGNRNLNGLVVNETRARSKIAMCDHS